jgi:hypothetical protein
LCDVAQQVLFAQEPGRHAFSASEFKRIQDRAEMLTGATRSAAAMATEIMILLNIAFVCSTT